MQELWQLYDEQGRFIAGKGAPDTDVYTKGLLHGAAHVWIWRRQGSKKEVLLQKRAATKRTWPNRYDISAAGHIDLGETPLDAAIRESKEEINVDISEDRLRLISVQRAYLDAGNHLIENEFRWLYLLELPGDTAFQLQEGEVSAMEWMPIVTFKAALQSSPKNFVPHGAPYYDTVMAAIEAV